MLTAERLDYWGYTRQELRACLTSNRDISLYLKVALCERSSLDTTSSQVNASTTTTGIVVITEIAVGVLAAQGALVIVSCGGESQRVQVEQCPSHPI